MRREATCVAWREKWVRRRTCISSLGPLKCSKGEFFARDGGKGKMSTSAVHTVCGRTHSDAPAASVRMSLISIFWCL